MKRGKKEENESAYKFEKHKANFLINAVFLSWGAIHHINHIRTDNRIENLQGMTHELYSKTYYEGTDMLPVKVHRGINEELNAYLNCKADRKFLMQPTPLQQ